MSRFSLLSFTALFAVLPALAVAQAQAPAPKFATVFSDHAVLQRDVPMNVWGTAPAGDAVTVSLNGASAQAVADATGRWRAQLPTAAAGGPYTLSVSDAGGSTTLNDIMIGDVFMCGGQSNMQFPERVATGAWNDLGASANTNLRFILVQNDSEPAPLADLKLPAEWKVVGPDTVGDASAVCYHMAQTIQKEQNVAIGMIDSYWGGTTIQGWISEPSLRTQAKYVAGLDAVDQLAKDPARAMTAQAARDEAWWDAHDPSNKANRAFIAPGYKDSKWPTLTANTGWKDSGIDALKAFDGVVWYRTTITLTPEQAQTANELTLGPIDTFDTTWVNGTYVGNSGIQWIWRDYQVPAGVFKPGPNVIVIRALGGGGLNGQPMFRAVKTSDGQAIPLPAEWKYKVGMRATGLTVPSSPWAVPTSLSTLYNGMIAPFAGYHVKLAAWYQGEANSGEAAEYRTLLPLLMQDWRQTFDDPDLPFFVAQLSSFGATATMPGHSDWAELREAQRVSVNNDRHAGLAVTADIGDRTDIHPTQKTVVGARLARAADAVAYGKAVSNGGPDATGVKRSGADLVVAFRNTNGGLQTYSSNTAIGFEVCTAPDACAYATAVPNGDTVTLLGANRPEVTLVRYAWADAPYVNLYSADDLPAVPFELEVSQ